MFIIPARLASTRFKEKILADIGGVPMFVRTAQNVAKAGRVLVACDNESVLETANKFGIEAVLTSTSHESGTDRLNEAASRLALPDNELVINVQADEPFFEAENLAKFAAFAERAVLKEGAFMASCYKKVGASEAANANLVKVVTSVSGHALYFSRSLLPFPRAACESFLAHIGIYAYSVANLREFCTLPSRELENVEKLEQLRALQSDKKIAMMEIQTQSIGIDTEEDLAEARRRFGF